VRFLGRLDRAAVWKLLGEVDVLLAPSLWYETYCYAVHEAFAAGVPVVASRLGVLADAVEDGVSGLLVSPGDVAGWQAALQRLVDDPAQLAIFRAGLTAPPTLDTHVAQLEALYLGVAAGRPAELVAHNTFREA
jgi:glycosyltransferase involved in cell wall biosynthesis